MKKFFGVLSLVIVVACAAMSRGERFDKWTDLRQEEFNEALFGVKKDYSDVDVQEKSSLILSKLLAETPPPPIGNGDLISFSITEDVPLKDVFIELGRLADIDIQIDPLINKKIIFKATDKPINVIIDKVCDLASLKYEY
ncbi:MAG: hypothetical protein LBG48_04095, partial [Rickettsiales bacterium]|nr:hypothetical protein [Rickettsiales bacterium]